LNNGGTISKQTFFLLGLILIYYFETFFCDSLRNTKYLAKEAPEFSLFGKTQLSLKTVQNLAKNMGFFYLLS